MVSLRRRHRRSFLQRKQSRLPQQLASTENIFDSSPPFSLVSGHCKKLAPEYEAAAEVLSAQDPPRTIAKVDATENKALGDRFEIKGFPTLKFYK